MKNDMSENDRLARAVERYQLINPLLDQELDRAERSSIMEKIAGENNISVRQLQRYCKTFNENGLNGLVPKPRGRPQDAAANERFKAQLNEAIVLLRENPCRPVRLLIKTLVLEGSAEAGEIKRSTLQKHLFENGYGKTQLKAAIDSGSNRGDRFCMPHRMMLVQTDFKYSISLPLEEGNGENIKVYLCTQIDDHSRFILHTQWYLHQTAEAVEHSVKCAILKYGKFDKWYCDNGKQFNETNISITFAKLGIRKLNTKPYKAKSKGKIEKFHQVVNVFLNEVKLDPCSIRNLDDLNTYWKSFLDHYYLNDPHAGIAEYYKQNSKEYPKEGITPTQEFDRDSRELVHLDVDVVTDAFLHSDKTAVVRKGTISFNGLKYKAEAFPNGSKVTIFYDPFHKEKIILKQKGKADYVTSPIQIEQYINFSSKEKTGSLPEKEPVKSSRVLGPMMVETEKKFNPSTGAIDFSSLMK